MTAALHSHTEFSVRDSLLRADELPMIAAKEGWDAVAITDHGGVEGVPKFLKSAKTVGIKGIAGIEFYVGCPDSYTWGVYKKGEKLNHLTVLAKNANGFSSILKILSIAHRDCYDRRRQKAAVPIRVILEELEDCVVMSGCYGSPFWRGTDKAIEDLADFIARFKEDFFLEVQPLYDMEGQIKLNRTIYELSQSLGVEMVVSTDCHFASPEEQVFHEALLAVADRKSIHDPNVWKFSTKRSFLGRPQKAQEDLGRAGIPPEAARRALEATRHVSDRITDWSWNDLPAPAIPTIPGDMEAISWQGLEAKGLRGRPEYEERLKKELATFKEANLDRYFLLVKHCVDLFRREGAEMGPRGSVGGSLVAYCMGITPIDPIFYGLPYERFYAPGRMSGGLGGGGMPDVDLDLDEEFRERVPEVLRKEFGDDRVAQISNYTEFGLRMAIHDAARAYGIDLEDTSRFEDDKQFLKDIKNPDITDIPPGKELARKCPDAAEFARRLVGRVRQYGAHAGGFVIAAESLFGGRSAVVNRGKDKALCWDMAVAEELGFIKIDFLGLDTLSVIREIKKDLGTDLSKIPLDDAAVFEDFSEGLTAGVPQFLSPGMRSFIRLVKPTKFQDLVWANAAFRPGGLGQADPAGLARKYHDDPDSIIVYQEEVMRVCVDLAGFTWTEADQIRKIIAKSKGPKELEKHAPKFVEGCVRASGWVAEDAAVLWETLSSFGRYSFNKAHATAYSVTGYVIAWAKRHHPIETFTAMLNAEEENIEPIIYEAPKFGIEILPPDPNKSTLRWEKETGGIRMPLTMIDGVDLRLAKAIFGLREKAPLKDARDFAIRMKKRKFPPGLPETLFSGRMPGFNFTFPVLQDRGFLKKPIVELSDEIKNCDKCGLREHCNRPVPPELGRTNVMVVGEAPGWEEDKKGKPFVGKSGRKLDQVLARFGLSGKEFTYSNAACCAPPFIPKGEDGVMTVAEIEKCSKECPWLEKEIEIAKPPLILALGRRSWQKLGGQGTISKANATVKNHNGIKVVACLHPAYVLRNASLEPDMDRAIEKFSKLYRALVPSDGKPPVRRVGDPVSVRDYARRLLG